MIAASYVPPDYLHVMWPQAEQLLKRATDRSGGRYDIADVGLEVFNKAQQLWVVADFGKTDEVKAALTTRLWTYPRKKVLQIVFCGGDDLEEWQSLILDKLEEFAVNNGCSMIEIVGRQGWIRSLKKYGWVPSETIIEKVLT